MCIHRCYTRPFNDDDDLHNIVMNYNNIYAYYNDNNTYTDEVKGDNLLDWEFFFF